MSTPREIENPSLRELVERAQESVMAQADLLEAKRHGFDDVDAYMEWSFEQKMCVDEEPEW